MDLIYTILISLIFVIIGIRKNKLYEYQKVTSFAIIVYAILIRFMLLDGGITIYSDHYGTLIYITYIAMLIGIITLIFSYARE